MLCNGDASTRRRLLCEGTMLRQGMILRKKTMLLSKLIILREAMMQGMLLHEWRLLRDAMMLRTNKTEAQHVQKVPAKACKNVLYATNPQAMSTSSISSQARAKPRTSRAEHETTSTSSDSRYSCSTRLGSLLCLVAGIMSFAGHFHIYPVTRIESTKTLDIGRNFSYFLNLQYESRRLSSYLFKVDIDRLVA